MNIVEIGIPVVLGLVALVMLFIESYKYGKDEGYYEGYNKRGIEINDEKRRLEKERERADERLRIDNLNQMLRNLEKHEIDKDKLIKATVEAVKECQIAIEVLKSESAKSVKDIVCSVEIDGEEVGRIIAEKLSKGKDE